jgi:hypothetical protein
MDTPAAGMNADVRPAALGTGLVVELDRQMVRAVLFASVEGQGRFITAHALPSTALPPIDDATVAVKHALRAIEEQTGFALLGPNGVQSPVVDHVGVDFFAVTGHPATPLRLTIVALGDSPVVAPIVAAARRSVAIADLPGARIRTSDGVISGALFERHLRAIRPDTVVLIEGSSTEAEWSSAVGTLVSLVHDETVPQIIIIAREEYQNDAAQRFGEQADLRGIDPSAFSSADIANALETELHAAYEARFDPRASVASDRRPHFAGLVRAGDLVTRFLARRRNQTIVALACGDGTTLHIAAPDGGDAVLRADLDVATNVRAALDLDPDLIARRLPFSVTHEDIAHWVLNRALRPFTVASTPRDVAMEAAVVTALLGAAWDEQMSAYQGRVDTIVAGRPFSNWGAPALALLSIIDIVQPMPDSGLVEIVFDSDGILPAAGAIGEQSPALAADAVELDLMHPAAHVVVVNGTGSEGDLALRGQLQLDNGEVVRFTVPFGSIHRLVVPEGRTASLLLSCEPRFTIGRQPSTDDVVFGRATPLAGSPLGIIIDARGRPLPAAGDTTLRTARMASWLEDLGYKVT